jgi:DNA-binding transcriptional regulator LsrR (DeoR family)
MKKKEAKKIQEAQRLHNQRKNQTEISEILGIRRATIVN